MRAVVAGLMVMARVAAADCPSGRSEVHLGVPISAAENSATSERISVGAATCAGDELELGADYAFEVHPDADASGLLHLHVAYYVSQTARIELGLAAGFSFAFDFEDEKAIGLGAWLRVKLTNELSLFTGQPPLPMLLIDEPPLSPRPPAAYQVSLAFGQRRALDLNLPVGVFYSPIQEVHVMLATVLVDSNSLVDDEPILPRAIGDRSTPIAFATWVDVGPDLQLGVQLGDDLQRARDTFQVVIAGRFFLPHDRGLTTPRGIGHI